MGRRKPKYDPKQIVDAPEHHELARAMGTLTWGTWEHDIRPAEERIKDFCTAHPPEDPVRFSTGSLKRNRKKEFVPGTARSRLGRFRSTEWRPGSVHHLLASYGLKLADGPAPAERDVEPEPLKVVARRRNIRLRVLHGTIDASPKDMDAAKAEYLDRREKQQAAQEIRVARQRMREDLKKS